MAVGWWAVDGLTLDPGDPCLTLGLARRGDGEECAVGEIGQGGQSGRWWAGKVGVSRLMARSVNVETTKGASPSQRLEWSNATTAGLSLSALAGEVWTGEGTWLTEPPRGNLLALALGIRTTKSNRQRINQTAGHTLPGVRLRLSGSWVLCFVLWVRG
jgi:hypothetical protein